MVKISFQRKKSVLLSLGLLLILSTVISIVIQDNFFPETVVQENADPEKENAELWPRNITGFNGITTIERKPRRIISASVGHDEMTVALVPLERLVAVTKISKDPLYSNIAELVKDIPSVDRDPENIIALNPDVIVTSPYFAADSISKLMDLNISVIQTNLASNIDNQIDQIALLGSIYGEEVRALQLSQQIRARFDFIQSISVDAEYTNKQRVLALSQYSDQIWTAGSNSTEGYIIEAAGGINSAAQAGLEGNVTTSFEGLISMAPDLIIITQPLKFGGASFIEELKTKPALKEIPAIKNNRIYPVETKLFTTLSFWNIRGIEELAKILWPDKLENQSFDGFDPFTTR